MSDSLQSITFGGGCFWCLEAVYGKVKGVTDVQCGYSNGHVRDPSYEQVCTGSTGHAEVVKLVFDPAQVSAVELLEIFFVIHDPTTLNRQGHDSGKQYRSGIYCASPEQMVLAEELIRGMTQSGVYSHPIVTEVLPLDNYWPAEDYHQDYFAKNPTQAYCLAVAAPKVAKFRETFARLTKA